MEIGFNKISGVLLGVVAVMSLALAVALCGCGGGGNVPASSGSGDAPGSEPPAVVEDQPPVELVMVDTQQDGDSAFSLHVEDAVKGTAGSGTIVVGEGQVVVTRTSLEGDGFAECEVHSADEPGSDSIMDMWTMTGNGEVPSNLPAGTYSILVLVHEGATGDISISVEDAPETGE